MRARIAGEILSLPVFPHITHRQIQHVTDCLNQLVGEAQQGNPAVQ